MKFTSIGLGAAILVCSSFVFCVNSANAGWGHLHGGGSSGIYGAGYGSSGAAYGSSGAYSAAYGSSGAYSAAYGSSGGYAAYGSYGASSGGSSGGPGILARVAGRVRDHLAAKHANHAARRAAYGSSGYYSSVGGSSGGYTSYSSSGGGSSGSYSVEYPTYSGGSSGGSSGGVSYGSTGSLNYGTSSYSGTSVYETASQTPASTVSSIVSQIAADSVHLTVAVPNDAKIFVNGNATSSTGAVRQFVSRGLEAGKSYKFEVRAELQGADGQPMVEEKSLVVIAGQREQLQFAFADETRPIETAVILNVPEGAKVRLSGSETKATGLTRTFRTSQLSPGQAWDDYEIQVQLGDEIKSQTIRLIAGDKLQLTFDFDDAADKIAAR